MQMLINAKEKNKLLKNEYFASETGVPLKLGLMIVKNIITTFISFYVPVIPAPLMHLSKRSTSARISSTPEP